MEISEIEIFATKMTEMEVAAVEEFYIERLKMISKIAHEIIQEEREKNA